MEGSRGGEDRDSIGRHKGHQNGDKPEADGGEQEEDSSRFRNQPGDQIHEQALARPTEILLYVDQTVGMPV